MSERKAESGMKGPLGSGERRAEDRKDKDKWNKSGLFIFFCTYLFVWAPAC